MLGFGDRHRTGIHKIHRGVRVLIKNAIEVGIQVATDGNYFSGELFQPARRQLSQAAWQLVQPNSAGDSKASHNLDRGKRGQWKKKSPRPGLLLIGTQ